MPRDKRIVIFYVLYFSWLFTLTTLTIDVKLQNYFALVVVIFYLLFLRDYWDPVVFTITSILMVAFSVINISNGAFEIDYQLLGSMPIWLPLSWGTTAIALKKFYKIVNEKIS